MFSGPHSVRCLSKLLVFQKREIILLDVHLFVGIIISYVDKAGSAHRLVSSQAPR